jgi:hypothetical protein
MTHFLYFQKLALQHVFKKEGVEGALRRPPISSLHAILNIATRLSIPAAMHENKSVLGC